VKRFLTSITICLLCAGCVTPTLKKDLSADVIVYGATPGGITAAISAAREGRSVILLEQTKHVGGLSTSGLNRDESSHMDPRTFGGLSEEFVSEANRRSHGFDKPLVTWKGSRSWQSRFAEEVFLDMLRTPGLTVYYDQLLADVNTSGRRLTHLSVQNGTTYKGRVFIDATYEGDLLAAAGVSYTVGREARDQYGESLGGVRYLDKPIKVSPYDNEGNLLPNIMPGPPPAEFSASPHPICYNVRLNLTTSPTNRVEIEKPAHYDPAQYELLVRSLQSGDLQKVGQVLALYGLPADKRECNNRQYSIVSMSIPGAQTAWAEAGFEERDRIHQRYRDYTHGLIWFLKTDPRVPEKVRTEMAQYGLCKDEWVDNGHWPWYLYIRAARRMIGPMVMTQSDITENRDKDDVIHIGSHFIDSHHVARYAYDKDHFINEGRIWQEGVTFDIPYRAITPKAEECENLLVPVCVSASAVAFCAIRLEPTWMHLGEASGIAASLAIHQNSPVQEVHVPALQQKINQRGIPLERP
jgi:hypothetical protein